MKLDDYIFTKAWLLKPFKKIHPNAITLFGIFCNFLLVLFLLQTDMVMANAVLIVRCFCDILDGNVARRYNKTSKLGGILDTISDIMLLTFYFTSVSWLITNDVAITICVHILSLLIPFFYMRLKGSLSEHETIKHGGESIIEKIVEFGVNNSILVYLAAVCFNLIL